jgi:hypothetical protein
VQLPSRLTPPKANQTPKRINISKPEIYRSVVSNHANYRTKKDCLLYSTYNIHHTSFFFDIERRNQETKQPNTQQA